MHQFAIADPMHASGGVDARNPQAAHIAFAGTAVTIHVGHRAHDGFMRGTKQSFARTTMTFGHL
jgi:hypothetical protein